VPHKYALDDNGNLTKPEDMLELLAYVGGIGTNVVADIHNGHVFSQQELLALRKLFLTAHVGGCLGCSSCERYRVYKPDELGELLYEDEGRRIWLLKHPDAL
jgi:hypothetical protein